MRRLQATVIVALLCLAVASTAGAAPVAGTLLAKAVHLPDASRVSASPLAFLVQNASLGQTIEIRAEAAHVTAYARDRLDAGTVRVLAPSSPATSSQEDHALTGVRLTIRATEPSGIVGGYPRKDPLVSWSSPDATSVVPSLRSSVAEPAAEQEARTDDGLDRPWYHEDIDRPHLLVESPGEFTLSGAWLLKLRGVVVVIESNEGRLEFDTREDHASPAQTRVRWLLFDAPQLDATIDTAGAVAEMALSAADAAWTGSATVETAAGELNGEALDVDDANGLLVLDGRFGAAIEPSTFGGQPVARLGLTGDAAPSGSGVRVPAPASLPAWLVPLTLVVFGAAVAGGAVALARGRGRARTLPRGDWTADDCVQFFESAREAGRWDEALVWCDRALAFAPASRKLQLDRGLCLMMADRNRDAFEHFARVAPGIPDDGEADYLAAVLARDLGMGDDVVASWAISCLEKSPEYADDFDADEDGLTEVIERNARLQSALATAYARAMRQDRGRDGG